MGLTISGNALLIEPDPTDPAAPLSCIDADGLQLAVITGNTFATRGGTACTGVSLGPHTNQVNVQSNVYSADLAATVTSAGANTLGGGSA